MGISFSYIKNGERNMATKIVKGMDEIDTAV